MTFSNKPKRDRKLLIGGLIACAVSLVLTWISPVLSLFALVAIGVAFLVSAVAAIDRSAPPSDTLPSNPSK